MRANSARRNRKAETSRTANGTAATRKRRELRAISLRSPVRRPLPTPILICGPKRPGTFPWLSARSHRIDRTQIRAFCAAVGREFRPHKIVLFGSYAYGRPTRDSDVDLLVVMPFRGSDAKRVVEICSRVQPRFPVDLLLFRPEEIEKRLAMGDSFIRDVLARGKVLYEARHP